jgi:hypothetical protein
MNAESKLLSLRQKIEDSGCQVCCIQETKKDHFDLSDIRKFAPKIVLLLPPPMELQEVS